MTQKAAPNTGEPSGAATEPLVATESQDNGEQSSTGAEPLVATESQDIAMSFEEWLAIKKGPVETASYNEATRHLANAWKPELQSALQKDVYDADQLKEKLKTSILKLRPKKVKAAALQEADAAKQLAAKEFAAAADAYEASPKRLDDDVMAICTAAAFERFETYRSQTPAGKGTTESEIKTLAKLSGRLVKHLESMHQTSRELVEEILPIDQLQLLERAARSVAVASKDMGTRLADVLFYEQSTGRKTNKIAESVTRNAAAIFERRTGRKPVRIVDRVTGEAGGPFIEWLAELFSLLEIEASADSEARKYHEWISMETTAKK